jgi:hypothetical protein
MEDISRPKAEILSGKNAKALIRKLRKSKEY